MLPKYDTNWASVVSKMVKILFKSWLAANFKFINCLQYLQSTIKWGTLFCDYSLNIQMLSKFINDMNSSLVCFMVMCLYFSDSLPVRFCILSCGGIGVDSDTVWSDIHTTTAARMVSFVTLLWNLFFCKHFCFY